MYHELEPAEADRAIRAGSVTVIDIRDTLSYETSRVVDPVHLDNTNIAEFLETTDKSRPLIVYCYHGISSTSAAAFFVEQGFESVSHVTGGFEAWQQQGLPTQND